MADGTVSARITMRQLLHHTSGIPTDAPRASGAWVRFLGGMNFALALFSLLILANLDLFPDAKQIALFCAVFAVAHVSQFYFNLPVALGGGRKGESLWSVLSGPMRIIFVIDAMLMTVNGVLVVCFLNQ